MPRWLRQWIYVALGDRGLCTETQAERTEGQTGRHRSMRSQKSFDMFADELLVSLRKYETWPDSSDEERAIVAAADRILVSIIDAARKTAKRSKK